MSILFAATYPERTSALVLYGTYAKRANPDGDYPWAATWDERVRYAEEVERGWGVDYDLGRMAPGVDASVGRWWAERCRASASPAAARDLVLMNSQIDVREALPLVQAETLVLHRVGDLDARIEEGCYIAGRISNARFVELAGDVHIPWWNGEQIVAEAEEFLTGARPPVESERVLATVLFTDLVGSTQRARDLGDAAWARLLEAHHALVRRELERFGGEEIDTAGDGFLALFNGPARAIRCGLALSRAIRSLGLDVRAGVHTGEVERRHGGPPRGIAVHTGARIAAQAASGEVLVSATTRDLVAGSGIAFEGRGTAELKGLGPRQLFAARE